MPRTRRSKRTPSPSPQQDDSHILPSQLIMDELRKIRSDMNVLREEQSAIKATYNGQNDSSFHQSRVQSNTSSNAQISGFLNQNNSSQEHGLSSPSGYPISPIPATFQSSKCALPTFNGKGSFKNFKAHFEDACLINGWHLQTEKGIWLKMCLEGHARDVLHDNVQNFDTIIHRLQSRFGDQLLKQRYEMILPNRRRKPNEKLSDLANDIRNMVNVVYEELHENIKEQMAIKHFTMALESPAARYELSQRQHGTLDAVLEAAQVREMYFGKETSWHTRTNTQEYKSNATYQARPQDIASPPEKLIQVETSTVHPVRCRHCQGNHPSFVCQPCRYCKGSHYDNKCTQRMGNEKPMVCSPTAMGAQLQGQ